MMPKGRGCAYYKCALANYVETHERELHNDTVRSVRAFVTSIDKNSHFPVCVTFKDWTNHPTLQKLLFQCYRLRALNLNILHWHTNRFIVTPYDEDEIDVLPPDYYTVFMQTNRVPSLFLLLDTMGADVDANVLRELLSYTYEEVAEQLSRYCTDDHTFNQLVNACVQLHHKTEQHGCDNDTWRRYVVLQTTLRRLGLIHRVQLRPDNDYRFLRLVRRCAIFKT
uniref:ORF080 n=1 Tax=Spodoptera frugiperda granulovirus TaxID=307454 RepID=A0A346QW00_9BBAC|nr:ORF080 [Spodoptera frugiperda granulovirus]